MRIRLRWLIAALAVFLIATACKNSQTTMPTANTNRATPQSTPDHFAAVRTTYEKHCQNCHGLNGAGGPVKLEDGTKLKVPSLREGHALRHEDSEFEKQIIKGGDGMPAFADKLTPEQINEVIRFIRHEFQNK